MRLINISKNKKEELLVNSSNIESIYVKENEEWLPGGTFVVRMCSGIEYKVEREQYLSIRKALESNV